MYFCVCSCHTGTAKGTVPGTVTSFSDYITRTAEHRNLIRFDRNEALRFCPVSIIDDSLAEGEEWFTVVLSDSLGGQLGQNHTRITIMPDATDG